MHLSTTIPLLALLPTLALSHGLITSPPSRPIGPALTANCGSAVYKKIASDNTSYVEALPDAASKDPSFNPSLCNLWLCKGLQFADNPAANVQTWTAGQEVPVKIWLRIPHEGIANVSVVDAKKNQVVGDMLKVWSKGYAPGRKEADVPIEQREFSVTVPEGLEERCVTAGDCVLQWWWFGTGAKQTYESCVDFKIVKPAVKERAFRA
ncbi:uncharacterized protein EI97DRAFT_474260 [Westerdykella ornata]|uniref:Chitin-binding type-4 domain-containing protein n=1 Tax=Westerdykella ornata TaxID=318751 RepID=A0A6A6JI07_WESOR|nr:uncharacterized protein EI97DRAFT_474260 [Westerdykella ornata]KAF2276290.1 hypothetical protein EI97DRAFT_474260 [Westerdykella ornata]